MSAEVVPGSEAAEDGCEVPFDSAVTSVNETALFGPQGYNDYAAWGELTGLLAVQFPHLVALNIDDMTDHISSGEISAGTIARVTANMRRHAPWLALATATYFHCKQYDGCSESCSAWAWRFPVQTLLTLLIDNK